MSTLTTTPPRPRPAHINACLCKHDAKVNLTLQEKITELIAELTVEKTELSSQIRKFTSAKDDRPSSQNMGVMASVLLAVSLGLICGFDLSRMFIGFVNCVYTISKIRKKLWKSKSGIVHILTHHDWNIILCAHVKLAPSVLQTIERMLTVQTEH